MAYSSGPIRASELGRRDLLRTAGLGLLATAGAAALDGLGSADAAVVTPNPLPSIEFGPFTVALVDFATPPPTKSSKPRAGLNFLYHRGDGSGKLFVNDIRGKLWSLNPATGVATMPPFLDLAALRGGALLGDFYQQGLRSFAFHPNFANAGAPGYRKFYTVSAETAASKPGYVQLFTGNFPVSHHNVVAEWKVDAATLATVLPGSRRELFRIAQWRPDHCADQLMFNPNGGADFGNLYLTVGDGGNNSDHSDPYDQAQDLDSALGKILRFVPLKQGDGSAYGISSGNPFGGVPPRSLIYAYGLRHPQNLSFDTGTGAAICTDIGQHHVEEINILVKGGNYGWPAREGTFATDRFRTGRLSTLPPDDASNGYIYPVAQYDHDEGNPSTARPSRAASSTGARSLTSRVTTYAATS